MVHVNGLQGPWFSNSIVITSRVSLPSHGTVISGFGYLRLNMGTYKIKSNSQVWFGYIDRGLRLSSNHSISFKFRA